MDFFDHFRISLADILSHSKPDGVWCAWEWLHVLLFAGLNA